MSRWPLVPIGEVLRKSDDWISLRPDTSYQEVTVRLWGKGVTLRRTVLGADIASSQRLRIRAGQFIISRIDARNGACGIVPECLDGAVVSSDFPTFSTDSTRLLPEYFEWFSKTKAFIALCASASEGTTNRVRLKEPRFLSRQIALPSLSEQGRIVARIESAAAQITEATGLRTTIDKESPLILESIKRRVFQSGFAITADNSPVLDPPQYGDHGHHNGNGIAVSTKNNDSFEENEKPHEIPKSWTWRRLGELCEVITDGTHLTPNYVDEGRPFLSAQNVKPFRFMPQNHRMVSEEDYLGYIARVKPRLGDILMTRVGAMIGEAAIIDQDIDFAFYVSLCLIRPRADTLFPPYLLHWLNSPYGAASTREKTLGKGHSQGNLNLNLIRRFVIPLPPFKTQQAIVEYLEELRQRDDIATALRRQAAKELDAMLPAILNQAFDNS